MSRQFTLLGKLNIEENGRTAEVMKSPKTCGLLAYLETRKNRGQVDL